MIYITSSFSNLMFRDKESLLKRTELTKEEFYEKAEQGSSYIGAEDVAKDLGFAFNKETIKATDNDTILNATKDHGNYRFFEVEVMPSTRLCNQECEELI